MSNIIKFPPADDGTRMILRCDCGNCSFIVGMSGVLNCTACDREFINDVCGWVIDHSEAPAIDAKDEGEVITVAHEMMNSLSALRMIMRRMKEREDEQAFVMFVTTDGNSSWWTKDGFDERQLEWLERKFKDVSTAERGYIDGQGNRLAGKPRQTPES